MILLTGDIHGSHDIEKLTPARLDRHGLTRDDYLVILGDFGLVWNDPPTSEERYWQQWLEAAPWTTLVVLGNHENYPLIRSKYDVEPWKGGRVRRICKHVLQLVDNEIFEIDGHTFFVRGGAHSVDKQFRKEGVSWWPEEVPNHDERAAAMKKLQSVNWHVDYVLAHDAPAEVLVALYSLQNSFPKRDEYSLWLQKVANSLDFKRWFFGHHHTDKINLGKYTALYHWVVDLDLNERQAPPIKRR